MARMPTLPTFDEFQRDALARGFDEVLARGTPHTERYGSAGAVYWVARRN